MGDLLTEVERLRAENTGLQHLADCQANYVDGTATVNERLRQCRDDRKALRARVAKLEAVLRRHEWGPSRCLECYSVPPDHHIGCALDAALHGKETDDDDPTE